MDKPEVWWDPEWGPQWLAWGHVSQDQFHTGILALWDRESRDIGLDQDQIPTLSEVEKSLRHLYAVPREVWDGTADPEVNPGPKEDWIYFDFSDTREKHAEPISVLSV